MVPSLTFDPSCCDGGEVPNDQSCQPCGCDRRAGWTCELHRLAPKEDWTLGMTLNGKSLSPVKEGDPIIKQILKEHQTEAQWRKERPLATGVLDYFPDALLEVAYCSYMGNKQHHDGKPLHWDKSKSTDEADACMRHLKDRGTLDTDGVRHSAKAAWRALANLQREIDDERV